jgi:hypothetical protein
LDEVLLKSDDTDGTAEREENVDEPETVRQPRLTGDLSRRWHT